MAKAKARKRVEAESLLPGDGTVNAAEGPSVAPLPPERVHELLQVPGPHQPPAGPLRLDGFVSFWDPGVSVRTLAKLFGWLFYLKDFSGRFAGETDAGRWKQLRLTAAGPGRTFAEQRAELTLGEPPAAREVVTFLILHYLATGERLPAPWQRCREVAESGRRVVVGPLYEAGLEVGNMSDRWSSPSVGLAEVVVPQRR